MPTYNYECKIHGEFEAVHSIMVKLDECPQCKESNTTSDPPKRLISQGSSFILSGNGWARDSYSK